MLSPFASSWRSLTNQPSSEDLLDVDLDKEDAGSANDTRA